MKKHSIIGLTLVLALTACKETQKKQDGPSASQQMEQTEKTTSASQEWEVLFDGSSFDKWHGYLGYDIHNAWKLEDGAMVFYPPSEADRKQADGSIANYNLVTNKSYTSFELYLEWKVAEGANSGVLWGIKEDPKYGQPYETGPEIQVLDDERHPDAKNGETHQSGALYDMVATSQKVAKPAGEWNSFNITIDHNKNKGSVVFNGTLVVEFRVHGPEWDAMVAASKFKGWEGFGKHNTGLIGLQDHGDQVAYRNIKIREL